ncbi:hypothetical protein NI465_13650 [Acinetobacter lwoffii]|uniref:hypothetical protein n=1 Tax=Acinetobacter lwoffii TaxID=28090 RepID=UPI00209B6F36|nr:hypothetical protein [Acinetobacter lwoffii]MCO8115214.1 hypothetical protein [Acinetobacter lwoffii]
MSVLGTAREAYENHQYDKLVKKYDKHTADKLISGQLAEANITPQQFDTYRAVKKQIQNGALSVSKAAKEGEALANAALDL